MTNNTPYKKHSELKHKTTWYSPDSFQQIEECTICGMRFLHDPIIGYPITMIKYPSIWKCVSND